MSDISASASIYAHVALARHRILLQHAANRAVIGAIAVPMLLVGFGLLNAALFLYLRPVLGDIAALLVAALIHVAIGSLAMALTWKEHPSPELEALADAEASALDVLSSDASGAVDNFEAIKDKITRVGSNISIGVAAISGLQTLLSRSTKPAPPKE
jgi:uncharacterized membrane protein YraQ (UPF0718 family)